MLQLVRQDQRLADKLRPEVNSYNRVCILEALESTSSAKQTLDLIDTLYAANVIQQHIEIFDIANIDTNRSLEDSIVRMDTYRTHIYVKVRSNYLRQIEDNSSAIHTLYLYSRKVRNCALLRPFNFLLTYNIFARLSSKFEKSVAS